MDELKKIQNKKLVSLLNFKIFKGFLRIKSSSFLKNQSQSSVEYGFAPFLKISAMKTDMKTRLESLDTSYNKAYTPILREDEEGNLFLTEENEKMQEKAQEEKEKRIINKIFQKDEEEKYYSLPFFSVECLPIKKKMPSKMIVDSQKIKEISSMLQSQEECLRYVQTESNEKSESTTVGCPIHHHPQQLKFQKASQATLTSGIPNGNHIEFHQKPSFKIDFSHRYPHSTSNKMNLLRKYNDNYQYYLMKGIPDEILQSYNTDKDDDFLGENPVNSVRNPLESYCSRTQVSKKWNMKVPINNTVQKWKSTTKYGVLWKTAKYNRMRAAMLGKFNFNKEDNKSTSKQIQKTKHAPLDKNSHLLQAIKNQKVTDMSTRQRDLKITKEMFKYFEHDDVNTLIYGTANK